MNFSFTNKVILVTGGTSAIGKSTAIAFAESSGKHAVEGLTKAAALECATRGAASEESREEWQ